MATEVESDVSTAKKSRTVRGKKNQKLFNLELDDEPDNDEDDFYTGHVTKAFFDDIKANGLRLDQNLYNEDIDDDVPTAGGAAKRYNSKKTEQKSKTCIPETLLVLSDDEEGDEVVSLNKETLQKNEASIDIQSPSPPPPPKIKSPKKRRRGGKQRKKLLNAVENLAKDIQLGQTHLASESANNLENESEVCVIDDDADSLRVRVQIRGDIQRYLLGLEDPFSIIISSIAGAECVPERRVILVHNDKNLHPTDTPASINFHIADIIECHVLGEDDSFNDSFQHRGGNTIELVIQSRTSKHKELMRTEFDKPLSVLIEDYARRMKKDPTTLVFRFDGDIVKPNETPRILDIEDGDVLDVLETDVLVIQ